MSGGFGAKTVESPQRKMLAVSLKKTGLGTPALSGSCASFCTITDGGVGDYTVNFATRPFTQIPEVFVQSTTPDLIVSLGTVTALSAQILVTDAAGTPAEGDFHLLALGSEARDLVGP